MPKIVDHDARRREIAGAVLALAVRSGLESVTLRRVAAESGHSMGTIQHYFTDKEQLLNVAFEAMASERARRIQSAVDGLGPEADERTTLRTMITEVLPLTEQSRFEALVGAAYYIRALGHEPTKDLMGAGPVRVIGLMRDLLLRAREAGRLSDRIDPDHEAQILWSLMEPSSLMAGYRSPETAVAMVDYELDRVFR